MCDGFNTELAKAAEALGKICIERGIMIGSAESCTGGMIAEACTAISGSSSWLRGSIVAYDPAIKQKLLGVPEATIQEMGVVSKETAIAMAEGATRALDCAGAVSTTGYAGPTGGDANNPCGTVYMAAAYCGRVIYERHIFKGTRHEVRVQAALSAIKLLTSLIQNSK